jgi:hypothetical protein
MRICESKKNRAERSFQSQCVFALTFLGLDGCDPGLARGVERRIAPLKFRKAERESFNRNRREPPECACRGQQSESLNRKTQPWPRPQPDLREARTADSNPKQIG